MFTKITETEHVFNINKIVDNLPLAMSLARFSIDIKRWNEEIDNPVYLRDENEKREFIKKVKSHKEYSTVTKDKNTLEKLIKNVYFEFLLPYALLCNNEMKEFTNIAIIGLGFYKDNKDLLSS